MMIRAFTAIVFVFAATLVWSSEPVTGPIIHNSGAAHPVKDRDVPVDEAWKSRVVFSMPRHPDGPEALSFKLEQVARYLNVHAQNGIPRENMDVAVVIYAEALKTALDNDAYRERFGIDNPNYDAIMELGKAGVALYACGQSMGNQGVYKSELASPVKVGLSAMTVLVDLQQEGYVLMP
jgi:intracellular sulfur oxidation DsrE/DsrF family protein